MIQPGRDDNYPTSSGNVPAMLGYLPHIGVGCILAFIIIIIAWNMLSKGGRRRR